MSVLVNLGNLLASERILEIFSDIRRKSISQVIYYWLLIFYFWLFITYYYSLLKELLFRRQDVVQQVAGAE